MAQEVKTWWVSRRNCKEKDWNKYCFDTIIIKRKKESSNFEKIIN